MNAEIEHKYQEIGQAALEVAEGRAGKLLIYAEVADDGYSADLFYVDQTGAVSYRYCPRPLQELIYSLWEEWKKVPANQEWRALSYVIDNGKFSIDLTYPDQIKSDEALHERRPSIIKKHFSDRRIDYSRPEG